jgi:hypothetical protein
MIWAIGSGIAGTKPELIGWALAISGDSVTRYFKDVTRVLTTEPMFRTRFSMEADWMARSMSVMSHFTGTRNLAFSIDGVLMRCRIANNVPEEERHLWYRGSKGPGLNCGVLVDGFGVIRMLYGCTPAHQHDSPQWRSTPQFEMFQEQRLMGSEDGSVPANAMGVGDMAYGNCFTHIGVLRRILSHETIGIMGLHQHVFNLVLTASRQAVERAIGRLKRMFTLLTRQDLSSQLLLQALQCGVWLHNFRVTHDLQHDTDAEWVKRIREREAIGQTRPVVQLEHDGDEVACTTRNRLRLAYHWSMANLDRLRLRDGRLEWIPADVAVAAPPAPAASAAPAPAPAASAAAAAASAPAPAPAPAAAAAAAAADEQAHDSPQRFRSLRVALRNQYEFALSSRVIDKTRLIEPIPFEELEITDFA